MKGMEVGERIEGKPDIRQKVDAELLSPKSKWRMEERKKIETKKRKEGNVGEKLLCTEGPKA